MSKKSFTRFDTFMGNLFVRRRESSEKFRGFLDEHGFLSGTSAAIVLAAVITVRLHENKAMGVLTTALVSIPLAPVGMLVDIFRLRKKDGWTRLGHDLKGVAVKASNPFLAAKDAVLGVDMTMKGTDEELRKQAEGLSWKERLRLIERKASDKALANYLKAEEESARKKKAEEGVVREKEAEILARRNLAREFQEHSGRSQDVTEKPSNPPDPAKGNKLNLD
jgi:hypothetical protein